MWPLDALFGANDDGVEVGPDAVRGVPATRYRLTVDLARADAVDVSPPGPGEVLLTPAEAYRLAEQKQSGRDA